MTQNLIGKRYGYLVVEEKACDYKKDSHQTYWKCRCDCGNFTYISTGNLNAGRNISCSYHCTKLFKNKELMIGRKFGKLTILDYAGENSKNRFLWKCKCDCGNDCIAVGSELVRKRGVKSCGCAVRSINGHYRSRLYRIHHSMLCRCYTESTTRFQDYGGRGITVCDEWREKLEGFNAFYEWALNNGYDDNLTLDRIDVNGNYEPSNCRWATREVQENNKRSNRFLTFEGRTLTMAQWSREMKINRNTLDKRIKNGWSISDALTMPVNKNCATKGKK